VDLVLRFSVSVEQPLLRHETEDKLMIKRFTLLSLCTLALGSGCSMEMLETAQGSGVLAHSLSEAVVKGDVAGPATGGSLHHKGSPWVGQVDGGVVQGAEVWQYDLYLDGYGNDELSFSGDVEIDRLAEEGIGQDVMVLTGEVRSCSGRKMDVDLEVEFVFEAGFFAVEWSGIVDEMETNGSISQTGKAPAGFDKTAPIMGDYCK
jgi:hypothetical protein